MTTLAAPPTNTDWTPAKPWACPDGELVLPYDAPRERWLAARRASIGASEVAAVLGLSKWKDADPYTVWAEKKGHIPSKEQTRAMARGLIMERSVVDLWVAEDIDFPIEVRRRGLMRSRTRPHIAASLDFLSVCPLGRCCIEVKTQGAVGDYANDGVPLDHELQGQAQLFVTGRDHVHHVAMGHRFETQHRIRYRDDTLIEAMLTKLDAWWEVFMVGNVAPPTTAGSLNAVNTRWRNPVTDTEESDAVVDLPEHLWAAPKRDQELADRIAELQVQRDALSAQVRQAAGNATILRIEGDPVGTYNPTAKIVGANAKFIKAHPELVAPFMEPQPTLNVAALVAAHPELLADGTLRKQRNLIWTV